MPINDDFRRYADLGTVGNDVWGGSPVTLLDYADEMADAINQFADGELTVNQLKDAVISYLTAKEQHQWRNDVAEVVDKIQAHHAPITDKPRSFICTGGWARCEDCRCGLPDPQPHGGVRQYGRAPRWTPEPPDQTRDLVLACPDDLPPGNYTFATGPEFVQLTKDGSHLVGILRQENGQWKHTPSDPNGREITMTAFVVPGQHRRR